VRWLNLVEVADIVFDAQDLSDGVLPLLLLLAILLEYLIELGEILNFDRLLGLLARKPA